ncbi:MAG: 6-phosphogluconolactonase [Bacteroidota bacterium]
MSTEPIIKIHKKRADLYRAAADHFVEKAQAAIKKKEKFTVCLSGGKTPQPLYELLATPEYAEQVNWKKCHIFFGDERCVPPTHDDSNYGMVYDLLLRKVKVPKSHVYKMDGSKTPRQAAQAYTQVFQEFFGATKPFFDLAFLGMGTDGHIASMFPGTDAVKMVRKRVREVKMGKNQPWRITVTSSVFNRTKSVVVLVSGKKKAATLKEVLEGEYNPELLPAQTLRNAIGEVSWFLDEGAASLLDK